MTFSQARIRTQAEQFSTAEFHRHFIELFERLGVDPALYAQADAVDGAAYNGSPRSVR
jgi:hypothetical protein